MRDVAPPSGPWIGRMRWCDLAFLHWPVPAEPVRRLLPEGLHLDTYDGQAWVSVVPFRMEGVRLRAAPPVPTTHAFAEINVRTYVHAAGRAGVWFFSLDATSRLAVRGARVLYHLPYYDADIALTTVPPPARASARSRQAARFGDWVHYVSRRTHRDAAPAHFEARYGPVGDTAEPEPGTLDHFLVERYCMFVFDQRRGLGVLDVDHVPWPLQPGSAEIVANTMADAAGIMLPSHPPLVHFARALDVRAWSPADAGAWGSRHRE